MGTTELVERDATESATCRPSFDVRQVRRDFPILSRLVHGKPLVYLDSAATAQKPQSVIDAISNFYTETNANIHRGLHQLSEQATNLYEDARITVQSFINAPEPAEVVFVRGTTEGINLIAQTFGRQHVQEGDELIISEMEHHSNIVPWQMLCKERGAQLRVIPINDDGELRLDEYERLLGPRTKLVAVTHVSNALGTINPVRQIIERAHHWDVPVLIDGAQAVPHLPVDVRKLDCDFYTFSGHKLYGPTGIGVVYAKKKLLDAMPPYQTGGDMIRSVTFEETTFNELPHRFEAGTPNIAGAVGLGAAIDYLKKLDFAAVSHHERALLAYATETLSAKPGVRLIGTASDKTAVVSFVLDGVHPHDLGTILDREGIAVRTGYHCAQPAIERFGVPATTRLSLGLYNIQEEIDAAVEVIDQVREVFRC